MYTVNIYNKCIQRTGSKSRYPKISNTIILLQESINNPHKNGIIEKWTCGVKENSEKINKM